MLHVPIGRIRDESQSNEKDDWNASSEDCDVMPRHDGTQAVGNQGSQCHDGHRQTGEPSAVLRLGDFGNKDLENYIINKYYANKFFLKVFLVGSTLITDKVHCSITVFK